MKDEESGSIVLAPPPGHAYDERQPDDVDFDTIVRDVTDAVIATLEGRSPIVGDPDRTT